ncbi:restriction endonuclease subunit S [Bifidobacterium bifidum]|uniref:Restriction endonuclease subunit S n=3 Tax=Bifidobacterium bifidum TaxID=1681 RepID=A0A415C8W9_BIFBI|nr:restriction endonuclease subunit S [Bifidobacterium bifidum]
MAEQAKVPAIRFAGFTDPWEQRKLGELGFAQSGIGFPDAEQGGAEGTPFFKVSDMNTPGNEYELAASKNYVTAEQIARMGWHPLNQVPAIFFAKVGAAVMLNRKRLVNEPFLLDNNTMAFSMDSSLLDTQFGQSLFERLDLTSLIQVGALPSFNSSDVESISVSLPSTMDEQRQIGQYLCNLDTLITLHQRKYGKLVVFKKSMLEKMFPKDGESVPEIRFAGFTDPWEQRKFSDIVDVCSGKDYKHLEEGPIPVYGTGGFMTSVDEALSYDRDAVGIGRKGTIDKPYLLKAPFWTVDTLFYAIPKSDMELEFVHCSFLNVDWKSKDESTGLPSLSKEAINETIALVPSFNEQSRLGEFFSDLDSLITLHQRKLELLQNIKKSLLDKMFV